MRKTITIPAAGEVDQFPFTGKSVIIEKASIYPGPSDVPLLGFNGQSPMFGIHQNGTVPYFEKGTFNRLQIKGTTESAGDEITLVSVNQCLPLDLKPNFGGNFKISYPKAQFTKAVAGATVVTLSSIELQDNDGNLPSAVYISAVGFDIRYAYGADPTATLGFDLLATAENPTEIGSLELVQDLRFANETTDGTANATLNILPEYGG